MIKTNQKQPKILDKEVYLRGHPNYKHKSKKHNRKKLTIKIDKLEDKGRLLYNTNAESNIN